MCECVLQTPEKKMNKKKKPDKTLNNRAKNTDSIYYCINLPLFRLLNKLNVIKKFLLMGERLHRERMVSIRLCFSFKVHT